MPADGYGVTRLLFKNLARARRGAHRGAHPLQARRARAHRRAAPKLVLAESVTNPLLRVPDIRALARAAGRWARPSRWMPPSPPLRAAACELGADYAIQSTTKWLNGHSGALGGAVSGSREKLAALRAAAPAGRRRAGALRGVAHPARHADAAGAHEGPLRARAARGEAAVRVAARRARPLPGPAQPPGPRGGGVLQDGFGGMVAFDIKGAGRPDCFRFLEAVKLARAAPSLGDVCTLVMHAASASARRMTPRRQAAGIGESLIRVSVGLEDPDDIADDLLAAVAEAVKR